jgi:uncharacterized protein YqgV (UPF0045/DUF77 family)
MNRQSLASGKRRTSMVKRIPLEIIPSLVKTTSVSKYIADIREALRKKYPHAHLDIEIGRDPNPAHLIGAVDADTMQEVDEARRYIAELLKD